MSGRRIDLADCECHVKANRGDGVLSIDDHVMTRYTDFRLPSRTYFRLPSGDVTVFRQIYYYFYLLH